LTLEDLKGAMNPSKYIGRSKEQTEEFIGEVIDPIIESNKEELGLKADIKV
jgi:adenylosuccinate lyase